MADNYSTEQDYQDALQNANPSDWTKTIFGGLLGIANTAVGNLTGRNQTAVTQPVQTTSPSWFSKLDTKTVVLLIVAGLAVAFLAKKMFK